MALKMLPMVRERGTCCALPTVNKRWAERTAHITKALADPTRLTMLAAVWKSSAPVCICDFVAGLDLSQSTISHHMAKLKEAGLVESEKRGLWIHYRRPERIRPESKALVESLLA